MTNLLESLLQLLTSAATLPSSHPIGHYLFGHPSQISILPDPTANLDCCAFQGAIPDIFSANAVQIQIG